MDDIEHQYLRTYGKHPTFLELKQFKANRPLNVYVTTQEHDFIIATRRSRSWKEASLAEKVRDGVAPPDVLEQLERRHADTADEL